MEKFGLVQGSLTEGEGSVDLFVLTGFGSAAFDNANIITFFYKMSYLCEEVNLTEPSPSVSLPKHVCGKEKL